ncbi:hypothetical protein MGU_11463 [Metarhizium guizhouense ARSEF 977]|uniref:Uncharacterized protein n=1 Tax=Metarhizium guizhouense (strain ARSEF 977) TaxID=1276136 RepID=A0A0B4G3L2_METGA|nr:hypothetical protein MGU_11463 [Metarhizium guizhouense ARSEF 977]
MFMINVSLYLLPELKTGDGKGKEATTITQERPQDGMVALTLEDVTESLNKLGIYDSYLHSVVEANSPGTVVRVIQNCRMSKKPDRPEISTKLEEQEVAIAASMRSLEVKESEINLRVSTKLQEERELKKRLQFLTGKVADMQQKLDQSCWDATEPERGIRDDEEHLFSLED